jgi:hypothetical protein
MKKPIQSLEAPGLELRQFETQMKPATLDQFIQKFDPLWITSVVGIWGNYVNETSVRGAGYEEEF